MRFGGRGFTVGRASAHCAFSKGEKLYTGLLPAGGVSASGQSLQPFDLLDGQKLQPAVHCLG